MAQDSLEHAHAHGSGHDPEHGHASHDTHAAGPARSTRAAAVTVAIIAAVAVVVEMSANDRQTAYLAHDVAASDLWAQYQGKSVRHTVMLASAAMLDGEAGIAAAADPGRGARLAQQAADARAAAARLEDDPAHDGMRQVAARAGAEQQARDRALELHEKLERSVRGLQIAIVLIGLFMATRLFWLLGVGGMLGLVSLLYGLLAGLSLL